jgi:hypothetical protein
MPGSEKKGVPAGRDPCVHCGQAGVPDADNATATAARGLGLCYSCYGTPEVRTARRKVVGPADHKAGRKSGRDWAGKGAKGAGKGVGKTKAAKLLPAPRAAGSTPARRRARKRPVAGRTGAPPPAGDFREEIGAVLKVAFARFAAAELRAIADGVEAGIEEG